MFIPWQSVSFGEEEKKIISILLKNSNFWNQDETCGNDSRVVDHFKCMEIVPEGYLKISPGVKIKDKNPELIQIIILEALFCFRNRQFPKGLHVNREAPVSNLVKCLQLSCTRPQRWSI